MKKLTLAIIAMLAFVFVLGTMGAYANGNIGFGRCLIQCAVCVLVEWLALKNI